MADWLQHLFADRSFWNESRRRWAFGGVLALIGMAAFVELVLAPGSLIRHPIASPTTETTGQEIADQLPRYQESYPAIGLMELLVDSAETRRMKLESREAAARGDRKSRLMDAQAELTEARSAAGKEWQGFLGEVQHRHRVDLGVVPFDPRSQPRELNQLILSGPTAAAAWAAIRNLASQMATDAQSIDASIQELTQRLERNTFTGSDARRQQTLLAAVQAMRARIRQGHRDLDHIDVQARVKAFLSRNERKEP